MGQISQIVMDKNCQIEYGSFVKLIWVKIVATSFLTAILHLKIAVFY